MGRQNIGVVVIIVLASFCTGLQLRRESGKCSTRIAFHNPVQDTLSHEMWGLSTK